MSNNVGKSTISTNDYLFAFGLTVIAGLTTCIGALIVLNKKLIRLAKPANLGMALGASAGVMIYISLAEIFGEGVAKVEEWLPHNVPMCAVRSTPEDAKANATAAYYAKICEGHSLAIVSACFAVGIFIIFAIDLVIHKISPEATRELNLDELNPDELNVLSQQTDRDESNGSVLLQTQKAQPVTIRQTSTEEINSSLVRTGILTAIALAIHNFPEGFAVFTSVFSQGSQKYPLLVIGIALHNIPEGVAVAAPVYYAKKSKLRAFLYTLVSALAEPLGGALAWIIKYTTDGKDEDQGNPFVVGIIFGGVAGMMVTISLKELIPNAYRFCESRNKVTLSIIGGMLFIAISVIVLKYIGL